MPQNSIKNYFWVVSYYFSYKNGPSDLVRGLLSCLDVGTYILPTCGPLHSILGSSNAPKRHRNFFFLIVPDYFSHKQEPNDFVRGPFWSSYLGPYIRPTWGPLCTFLGPFGGSLMPKNLHKGPQVGGMYVPMSELESKPLTKSIGPIL
jgi:hypothetical protein